MFRNRVLSRRKCGGERRSHWLVRTRIYGPLCQGNDSGPFTSSLGNMGVGAGHPFPRDTLIVLLLGRGAQTSECVVRPSSALA